MVPALDVIVCRKGAGDAFSVCHAGFPDAAAGVKSAGHKIQWFHMIPHSQYRNPSTQVVNMPYKMTGPAIVKILQPIPKT